MGHGFTGCGQCHCALNGLPSSRRRSPRQEVLGEGDNIEQRLGEIEVYESTRVQKIRQRLEDRLLELTGVDYDKNRLEQELIYYIEKLDISEEKQRLANHPTTSARPLPAKQDKARSWASSRKKWVAKSIRLALRVTKLKCKTSW